METLIQKIRGDFPTLVLHDTGKSPIHYLDNGATTLKPQVVLDAMQEYYIHFPANIHRGAYAFSQKASEAYENAREKVAKFIGAKTSSSIIFTSGTTASSNLFARSFIESLEPGDEIITTEIEHHSNLVNWQILCQQKGIVLKYLPIHPQTYNLDPQDLKEIITPKTKLLTVTMASNTLGVITPIKELIAIAHQHQVLVCADMAQAIAHFPIDVEALDLDFGFFSGHKIFAPTGIGIFYAKKELLKSLDPFFYGGGMVSSVTKEKTTFQNLPERMEAGTPPIAQAIGLGAAVDYISHIGWDTIQAIEHYLTQEMQILLAEFKQVNVYTTQNHHLPLFSFNLDNIHSHDVASILDESHIAVRTGQHCSHILLASLNLNSTIRASLSFYNNKQDILALKNGLKNVQEIFYGRNE